MIRNIITVAVLFAVMWIAEKVIGVDFDSNVVHKDDVE